MGMRWEGWSDRKNCALFTYSFSCSRHLTCTDVQILYIIEDDRKQFSQSCLRCDISCVSVILMNRNYFSMFEGI